jgi:hypothetical protein
MGTMRGRAGYGRPYTPSRGKFAGQIFASHRQYRNALAQELGFRSWYEQQRSVRTVRSLADLEEMHPREREANRASFRALDLMRDGLPFAQAVRRAGTTPAAVIRHVGPALQKRGGRWVARPTDRLLRVMAVLGEEGVQHEVTIRGSKVASLVGQHWSAINHYLNTGDDRRLRALRGKRVAGIVLETDPDAIDVWERRGELTVDDIYSLVS